MAGASSFLHSRRTVRITSVLQRALICTAALSCAACQGPFSTLEPAGRDAQQIASLFWWMAGGAFLIWALVMSLSIWAIRTGEHRPEATRLFIVGGGTVLPFVVLTILLVFGLAKMPAILELGPPQSPRIRVVGEQWWWRIEVTMPDGRRFETANEVYLPVGKRVTFEVQSADVIHSFWVPSLGGKMDMIPGRTNQIALQPTRVGRFGGWCAEYCGLSHAQMRMEIQVVKEQRFLAWVAQQMKPADARDSAGARTFSKSGCGACHTVRGTKADGTLGPDLTHVGSRAAVGAGILPTNQDSLERFLRDVSQLKPGSHMPAFDMLPPAEIRALAAHLEQLK